MTRIRQLVAQLRARSYFDHPKFGVVVKASLLAIVSTLIHAFASATKQSDSLHGFYANVMTSAFVEALPLAIIGAAMAGGWFAAQRTQSPVWGWAAGAAVLALLLGAEYAVQGSLAIERWFDF